VEGSHPRFGPGGEISFRKLERHSTFVYRINQDGSGLRKAIEQEVFGLIDVSRDGRWVEGWAPLPGNGPPAFQAFALDGLPSPAAPSAP
jgi:hypothetical protein